MHETEHYRTIGSMSQSTFDKNLAAIQNKNPALAAKILSAQKADDYRAVETSKTGMDIPVFKNGHLLYSKYNPEKECASLFHAQEDFILFCGLASGIHIAYFLKNFPGKNCAITEISLETYKALLSLTDLSAVLKNKLVRILPPISDADFAKELAQHYLPALDGNFRVLSLRAWENFYADRIFEINKKISNAIQNIQTDTATQARFARVWLKNILHNLQVLSTNAPKFPKTDTKKTALICGAGPSLTEAIPRLKKERERFVVFASDTGFLPLLQNGIEADFFLSIDPQIFSLAHFDTALPKHTVGVFDLCGLDILARQFLRQGNEIFFTASRHPLVQYAAQFSPLPFAHSSSGTVAVYALDVAYRLGFTKFEYAGMDFCYAKGKAYANGSYFQKKTIRSAYKLFSTETFFTDLMFRTHVEKIIDKTKITYTNEILNFYRNSLQQYRFDGQGWSEQNFQSFPYKKFFKYLLSDLEKESESVSNAMLPFLLYCIYEKKKYTKALAIQSILKYNRSYE